MNVRMSCLSLCCLLPLVSAGCCAQEAQAVLDELVAQFKKEGIKFDAKAQTVTIPAVVNQPQDPVEYLLIHKRGKKHEAVFWTDVKPSVFNGALLMLGLEPGKNAAFVEKDPAPTLEEIQQGADPLVVTPPKGMQFYMTVRWQTPEKKQVEVCVEDLLLDLTTQKPLAKCEWIFLGGRMAQLYKGEPEVFIADFEGNLFSICYLTPDNHLATMAHERARDDNNWWITNKLPEPGTEVELVIHRVEPPMHVERQKRVAAEAGQAENKGGQPGGKQPGGK